MDMNRRRLIGHGQKSDRAGQFNKENPIQSIMLGFHSLDENNYKIALLLSQITSTFMKLKPKLRLCNIQQNNSIFSGFKKYQNKSKQCILTGRLLQLETFYYFTYQRKKEKNLRNQLKGKMNYYVLLYFERLRCKQLHSALTDKSIHITFSRNGTVQRQITLTEGRESVHHYVGTARQQCEENINTVCTH